MDNAGVISDAVENFTGLHVHNNEQEILNGLAATGNVLYTGGFEHNYPHCWRCDTPLIYRAMDAWYLAVESVKDRLVEKNLRITWVPEVVKHGRFENWLKGARDWNISRNRYWGTPLPVWVCSSKSCDKTWVAGSADDLEAKAGHPLPDLHMEFLDTIEFPCDCGGVLRRTPEVLDGWFESGAMPFAQCHFPFENEEWFNKHFPADFITEYPGQIRAWFYYLHVLAVAVLDKPAFKTCLVHGTLLNKDGQKFSKSKKNYVDPLIIINRYGADAIRLYLLGSSAAVLNDLHFNESEVLDTLRRVILPFWNAFNFFKTYAEIDGFQGLDDGNPRSKFPMDRWICTVVAATAQKMTAELEGYVINRAVAPLVELVENLTNWYIRRTRERFWSTGNSESKDSAYSTLFYVLATTAKLLAPIAPFISDYVYRAITGRESVHLSRWPAGSPNSAEQIYADAMQTVRTIVALGLSLRQKAGHRSRQPLRLLRVLLPDTKVDNSIDLFLEEITTELNVQRIEFVSDYDSFARIRAVPDARKLGPRFGRDMQRIIKAAREGAVRINSDRVTVFDSESQWNMLPDEIQIGYEGKEGFGVTGQAGIVVALDTTLDDNLIVEGIANDLNREIQNMRKEAGYRVKDRIYLDIEGPIPQFYKERLADAALAVLSPVSKPDAKKQVTREGRDYVIGIALK